MSFQPKRDLFNSFIANSRNPPITNKLLVPGDPLMRESSVRRALLDPEKMNSPIGV